MMGAFVIGAIVVGVTITVLLAPEPEKTERELKMLTGVVECGLFVHMADLAVVATDDAVEVISRSQKSER